MKRFATALVIALAAGCGQSERLGDELQVRTSAVIPGDWVVITGATATASANDGNVPANVLDNDYNTRWSCDGIGCWIKLDLGSSKTVCGAGVAWYQGTTRVSHYVLATSTDNSTFTTLKSGDSSGTTTTMEPYSGTSRSARYVRLTVNGNTVNNWASVTEMRAYSSCGGGGNNVVIGSQSYAFTGWNQSRDTNELVAFNNSWGSSTGTNEWGTEVAVDANCNITAKQTYVGNMSIPSGGYVLSGHGTAREWLTSYAQVGGTVSYMPGWTCGGGGCTPTTCAAQGKNCGTIPDGCGSNLNCGSCTSPQTCGGGGVPNVCGSSGSGDDYAYQTLSRVFNGTNNYLSVANSTDWSTVSGGALTWSVWIAPNVNVFPSSSDYIHFAGKGQGSPGTAEWCARLYSNPSDTDGRDGRTSNYQYDPDGNGAHGPTNQPTNNGAGSYFQDSPPPPLNTWRMVSGTFNDAINSGSNHGRVRIYKNGVLKDTDWMRTDGGTGYWIVPRNESSPLNIGRSGTTHGYFKGRMAYFAIFKSELSATRLLAHYNAINSGNYVETVLQDNPVGFWSLETGSNGLVDMSGHGRNLTQNGTW